MSSITTITELRTMQIADLRRELRSQQTIVSKMRLQIELNTEKDTARYKREKSALARMTMVMGDKTKAAEVAKGTKGTEVLKGKTKTARAHETGKTIAALAKEKGITRVSFDRGGFLYAGRVKAVAEGAREGGLMF